MRIVYVRSGRLSIKARLIIALAVAVSAGVVALFALLAISALLVMLPVVAAGALIYAFLPKRRAGSWPQRPAEPGVLEGDYRVVEPRDRDRLPRE